MKEIWYGFDKNGNVVETFMQKPLTISIQKKVVQEPRVESFDWSKHK